jgi:hypothetical protein
MLADPTASTPRVTRCEVLFPSRPAPTLRASIIVPVRNEAHHLTATLDALRVQQTPSGQPFPADEFEVLVLANNCTDASGSLARQYQRRYPDFPLQVAEISLPAAQANVGTVRRLLMDEAYQRLTDGRLDGTSVIVSTDGDSCVDACWLFHTLREFATGVDAVSGRILTRPDGSAVRRYHLRDVTYRSLLAQLETRLDPCAYDPWPRHFQHFGASLAVTCEAYRRAGGLPTVPYLEDEAFFRALLRVDARVRHSPLVRVFTSTRQRGRVAIGFSEQLRCWATMERAGQVPATESPAATARRFRVRNELRRCWQTLDSTDYEIEAARLAAELGLNPRWLTRTLTQCRTFGALWEGVEMRLQAGDWAKRWPPVPVTQAIDELRHLLQRTPIP